MKTTKRPLALHLRRARRLHNGCGLTQRAAAKISGIAAQTIRRYEKATKLPRAVTILLRLALTYHLPIEALIPETVRDQVMAEIEGSRTELEYPPP
jgi:transcriptional regulator with XRE-family HTH domain